MNNWNDDLGKKNIFFITPDIKRGIGLEDILPNYHIICTFFDPIIPILRDQGAKIFVLEDLIGEEAIKYNNSGKILEHKTVADYITGNTSDKPYIAYFKPSLKMDLLIKEMGYIGIGNTFGLNEKYENKINFGKFMETKLPDYSIPSVFERLKNLDFKDLTVSLGVNLVIQFGHGWAGQTTYFVNSDYDFTKLKLKYPQTEVKISKKISGKTILNNCCIYQDQIMISPPAVQLSGIPLLHENAAVTCGRQWPADFLTYETLSELNYISMEIGKFLKSDGYQGLFGLDFLVTEANGRIFVSEINARLTASTPFFTRLQRKNGEIPYLAYHLASFTNCEIAKENKEKHNNSIIGSQVTFRKVYPGSILNTLKDFGTYKMENSHLTYKNNEYKPENLLADEFIFIRRTQKGKQESDLEISRIETRRSVLQKPQVLSGWLKDLITGL